MTLNVGLGTADQDVLLHALRESGADIIGLQEVSDVDAERVAENLIDVYPYQVLHPLSNGGPALLSRYPIAHSEVINEEWQHLLPYIQATLKVEEREVMVIVYRTHAPRFGAYITGYGFHTWRGGEELAKRLPQGVPLIVLGDFNTTDQLLDYGFMRQAGLVDAYRQSGWGYGSTYPARGGGARQIPEWLPPLFRIDYVWVTDDFYVVDAWVGEQSGGDHLPVLAELAWK